MIKIISINVGESIAVHDTTGGIVSLCVSATVFNTGTFRGSVINLPITRMNAEQVFNHIASETGVSPSLLLTTYPSSFERRISEAYDSLAEMRDHADFCDSYK